MFRSCFSYLIVILFAMSNAAQDQPKPAPPQESKIPVIAGDLGECTADLRVTDVKEKPIYNAKIGVEIKYGFGGFHRSTLEIYTNADGKARFEGLPRKSRGPLSFTVDYNGRRTAVVVEPRDNCHGSYTAILPNEPLPKTEDNSADE
ncbi:MAG: carboxypeptidase-like regulatory domain-containing protein [Terriglobales bacterium]